ncbi:unnamed protein product [Prunus armeniaca]|uniref:Uncharacterized protein n=1 Tax=Prunus armeniaca TaxID=36596 RepID=A0A6J5VA73_PRUAR|nr:unnamed protein product [Prunus armeniaca]
MRGTKTERDRSKPLRRRSIVLVFKLAVSTTKSKRLFREMLQRKTGKTKVEYNVMKYAESREGFDESSWAIELQRMWRLRLDLWRKLLSCPNLLRKR